MWYKIELLRRGEVFSSFDIYTKETKEQIIDWFKCIFKFCESIQIKIYELTDEEVIGYYNGGRY